MPVAAEKGVEGGTASPLILYQSWGRSEEGMLGIDKEGSIADKARISTTTKKRRGFLCSHPEVGVAFHSRFQKREKRKFRRRRKKQKKKKKLITSHPGKELRWPKPPT